MTEYIYRYFIFVEASKKATANNLAAQWDPDTGGNKTFGNVKLSPTGQLPATYYAAATWATPTMRDGITNALQHLSWAHLYTDPPFTWQSAMADMGLQRIIEL